MNDSDAGSSPMSRPALVWTGRVISALVVLLFGFSAAIKFMDGPEFAEAMEDLGLPESMFIPLAILELSCAVIYLIPQTAMLGAILLTGYMGGAICTHWRVGQMFVIQIILGLFIWLGLYLREPRLRRIIPLR